MVLLELEGLKLGEKHKSYNELLKKIVNGETKVELNEFNADHSDIENLLKIDNACNERKIEYILKVLVCSDMLYVSRALKQCQWLFSEKEYAHIINPRYLHTTLFPKMCVKAKIKLIKCVQLHLKDTARVEEFYEYEDNPEKALYWLPGCSLNFIERNIVKHVKHNMRPTIFKRLCEKSITILEIYINNSPSNYIEVETLNATIFLLRTHTQRYLDIIEKLKDTNFPKFSAITTKFIMNNCPSRILNNFERYCNNIHLPSFIPYLKRENIIDFLLQLAKKSQKKNIYLRPEVLRKFVEEISITERFEFIKKVFIDKEFQNEMCLLPEDEKRALNYLYENLQRVGSDEYLWYQYAPFDVAFTNITKMIENDVSVREQKGMLNTLLLSAGRDISRIQKVIAYVKKSKKITEFCVKDYFLTHLFKHTNFIEFNKDIWDILRDIVTRLNVNGSIDTYDVYQWAVIAHGIVNSEEIPESIVNNIQFNTMMLYHDKLNDNEKEVIFEYLYKHILNKLRSQKDTSKDEFKKLTKLVEHALNLLVDWEKDLKNFPELLAEIKNIIKTNNESNYEVDLSFVYNTKKSWRKYFFDESLYLCRNDNTLVNALKHDPKLLERYSQKANKPLVEVAPVKTFLRKIKIYYRTWLEKDWSVLYKEAFTRITKHQTICYGICTLYSREELKNILIEYAPKVTKLVDADIDAHALSYQRHLAKNMHYARPQPSPDLLFLYAKGDYLKYALPSLLAIFYNLSTEDSRKFLPKLLDSHVSLQKHGIRLAFTRLSSTESSTMFYNLWKSNTNPSIRCVLFKNVFELTCKEKNEDRVIDIWALLKTLIDGLTLEENKEIYDLLFKIEKLPPKIQAPYYMTVYHFMKKLCHLKDSSEHFKDRFYYSFVPYAGDLIDDLLPEFVKKILLEYINEEFNEPKENNNWEYSVIPLMSSCLLDSNDVESQMAKYNDIFTPFYNECNKTQKYCKISALLDKMRSRLPQIIEKKRVIPLLMFRTIQNDLLKYLSIIKNYNMLTKWKMTVTFVENLQDIELTTTWDELCTKIAPKFAKHCSYILKENSTKYFSYIYVLFSRALKEFLEYLVDESVCLDIYRSLLDESVGSHLVAIKLTPKYMSNDEKIANKTKELKNIFSQHPSLEVKIHYYESFKENKDSFYQY